MANETGQKDQQWSYKTLNSKLKIEQHELNKTQEVTAGALNTNPTKHGR